MCSLSILYYRAWVYSVRVLILSCSIATVGHWRFSSFSRVEDGALFFFSFSSMTLTCLGAARTPSMVKRGVINLYLAHVTSPNLLVFTQINISFGLGGRRLISFGTLIFGASG